MWSSTGLRCGSSAGGYPQTHTSTQRLGYCSSLYVGSDLTSLHASCLFFKSLDGPAYLAELLKPYNPTSPEVHQPAAPADLTTFPLAPDL